MGNGIWSGNIPAQVGGSEVFYYVEGTANSGKVQVRPIVAPWAGGASALLTSALRLAVEQSTGDHRSVPEPDISSLLVITMNEWKWITVEVVLADALGER